MAKTTKTTSTQYSKSKISNFFLCCFGSHRPNKASTTASSTVKGSESDPFPKKKKSITSWCSSWRRIRIDTKSTSKTVPLEPSFSHVKALYPKSRSKSSTLHRMSHNKPSKTNPPPPTQLPPVLPGTPCYSPTQTRHGADSNNTEDTREQGRAIPTRAKRPERRVSSTMLNQTTSKKLQNARGSYDPLVGMSVLLVTLVIVVFWGRLCAVLCTSAWLYFIPRFRKNAAVNGNGDDDAKTKSNDVDLDLDSEEYKRKVIMEGLLGRNHRGGII